MKTQLLSVLKCYQKPNYKFMNSRIHNTPKEKDFF